MTEMPLPMVGCAVVLHLAITVLLLLGVLGSRRSTRPRCRRCARSLTGASLLPSVCPGCGADLQRAGMVRFGGWRPRLLLLLAGLGLLALTVSPAILAARTPRGGQVINAGPIDAGPIKGVMINGVMIEEGVSVRRLEEATAARDAEAWTWLLAHLEVDALGRTERRRASSLVLEELRSGTIHPELAFSIGALLGEDGATELAEVILDLTADPSMRVMLGRKGSVSLALDWSRTGPAQVSGTLDPGSKSGFAAMGRPGWQLTYVMVITDIRVDGRSVRPTRPEDRLVASIIDPMPFEVQVGGRGPGDVPPSVEVDLARAILGGPGGAALPHPQLPGPPSTWPNVLAMRRSTIRGGGDAGTSAPKDFAPGGRREQ